jgi:hypothetical protein
MNLSTKDYKRLYQLQDKFLCWWQTLGLPFYLTGGTALGRFYLSHRFSEDLDFFCNANPDYLLYISSLKDKISRKFSVDTQQSLFAEDFTRFFISEENLFLKIELVNDVEYYPGKPTSFNYGWIDTPLNILSNKLTSIVGRDEPKDIFDIYHLALNYSFSWPEIFFHSKQKSVINEIDVAQRIFSFPVKWLEQVNQINPEIDLLFLGNCIRIIADDFLLGKKNSLGIHQIPIEKALPVKLQH